MNDDGNDRGGEDAISRQLMRGRWLLIVQCKAADASNLRAVCLETDTISGLL